MGGSSGTSTTTVQALPEYAQPYCEAYLDRAETLSDEGYAPYTGLTIAPQNQDEIDALSFMASRGTNGDPAMNEAVLLMELMLNGSFLPGTRAAFIDMWSNTQGSLATEIASLTDALKGTDTLYYVGAPMVEDRLSPSLEAYATKVMDRLEAKLYRYNYDLERSAQSAAIGMATTIGGHGIVDAEVLRMSGVYQREYDQAVLHDLYKEWLDLEESEIKRLEILGNGIRTLVGTQSSVTEPYYRASRAVSTIGGAMSGAAATAAMIPGVGWAGLAIGAVAGAVLGNLSGS